MTGKTDGIPLVSADDMLKDRKGAGTGGTRGTDSTGSTGKFDGVVRKKEKPEKPVRVIRIKYYERLILSANKEIFVVERGLEELLKALYCHTNIEGMIPPSGGMFVEKDNRMVSNDKFIFININRDELNILKKQLESHDTICALNKGEISILIGTGSYLKETFDMPMFLKKNWKEKELEKSISDTNTVINRQRLREELKDDLRAYHSYSDEDIDNMKEIELKNLKRLAVEKRKLENRKIKAAKKWKM